MKNKFGDFTMRKKGALYKNLGILLVITCTFIVGFSSGRIFENGGFSNLKEGSGVVITGDKEGKIESLDFNLFWDIWDTVTENYVDEDRIDAEKMFYGSIKGLVDSLGDPATVFLDPKETDSFNDSNEGKLFEGIGAELGYDNSQIVVISPIAGSPAEKAGVRPRDIILKVDGKDILPSESIYDVVQKIRGRAGTKVILTVLHTGDTKTSDIEIVRGKITLPSIEVKSVKNSGYKVLKVSRFTDSSPTTWAKNWDRAVDEVIKSNPDGVILDLRGNPGGYFDSAVYAAGEFLKKGSIVSMQEDRIGRIKEYKVTRNGKLLDTPLVVLVNSGSASASEILAGALQMNRKVVVIGEETYGKGTAQSILPLSGGSSLHLTTLKWLLPDGSWLNRDNPIKPDKVIEITDDNFKEGVDTQMDEALKYLENK